MTVRTSRQIHLHSRPEGVLSENNFSFVDVPLRDLRDGEVLVQNTWMSVDPYMRRRMNAGKFYMPPFEVGRVLSGGAVGTVIESRSTRIAQGDTVQHYGGWRDLAIIRDANADIIDTDSATDSAYLGVLGMPGLTAYVGLVDIADLREGDTVFVSGAAGAVGSLVGQLAKSRGHRVIGSAGSPEKLAWLRDELGFDAVFDYHDGTVMDSLRSVAPDGIDVYFDNVGYEHLEAAIDSANSGARFALCGTISDYNQSVPRAGPANLFELVSRRITMQGFIISDHMDRRAAFLADVAPRVRDGAITYRETVLSGLEQAPKAMMQLFEGGNVGKMLVKLD